MRCNPIHCERPFFHSNPYYKYSRFTAVSFDVAQLFSLSKYRDNPHMQVILTVCTAPQSQPRYRHIDNGNRPVPRYVQCYCTAPANRRIHRLKKRYKCASSPLLCVPQMNQINSRQRCCPRSQQMPEPPDGEHGPEGHLFDADIAGERGDRRSQSADEQPHQEEGGEHGNRGGKPIHVACWSHVTFFFAKPQCSGRETPVHPSLASAQDTYCGARGNLRSRRGPVETTLVNECARLV